MLKNIELQFEKIRKAFFLSFALRFKAVLVYILAVCIFFTNTFSALAFYPFTPAPDSFEIDPLSSQESLESIAILVDTEIKNLDEDFSGMTIFERINRYAVDVQNTYLGADIDIVEINDSLSPYDIHLILNNLYQNKNLSGVVLFGDIELPKILDQDEERISIAPYTDFLDKYFVYDEDLQVFVRNNSSNFFHAEIWHGLLRASVDDEKSLQNLANYLDKNHLYYSGDTEFSSFTQKISFFDFVKEASHIDETSYQNYLNYLNTFEEQAFNRYTKEFASVLNGDLIDGLDLPLTDEGADFFENARSTDEDTPDVQMKYIIDNLLPPYYKILEKHISDYNNYIESTGRYSASDSISAASEISIKDEFAKQYLKNLSLELEDKMTSMLKERADDLPIIDYSIAEFSFDGGASSTSYFRFNYLNEVLGEYFVNGVSLDLLDSVIEASQLAGSSKLVSVNRKDGAETSYAYPSSGVNTKMGAYDGQVGALIESFDQNFLYDAGDKYKNPIADLLKEGDLIVSVNDTPLSSTLSYEDAISDMWYEVSNILGILNNKNITAEEKEILLIDIVGEDFYEDNMILHPLDDLEKDDAKQIQANFSIEFYRNGSLRSEGFSFTIQKDGLASKEDPQGNPEFFVLYSDEGFDKNNIDFDRDSDAAIYTLYDTREKSDDVDDLNGFSNAGYDLSGGCSQNNTQEFDDRCFPFTSQIPIRDLSGGKILTEDQAAKIDDIDLWHFDSLYFGLQTNGIDLGLDSNPFSFVLDPATLDLFDERDEDGDIYGHLLKRIGYFIFDRKKGSDFGDSAAEVWGEVFDLKASDVILYQDAASVVTLKDFSDFLDIPENNINRVNRMILAESQTVRIPSSETSYDKDLVLKVSPNVLKTVPAIIVHNEPTDETISEQLKSYAAIDLPVDDPRYVAILRDGELMKFDFVNMFEVENVNDLASQLLEFSDSISDMDAVITGDAIYQNEFLDIVNSERETLLEVLDWMNMDINEKHAFVLEEGLKEQNEIAYVRLDGDMESFEIDFNKDLAIETDPNFDVIYEFTEDEEKLLEELTGESPSESGSDSGFFGDYEFVNLDEFMGEIEKFVDSFTMEPQFVDCCSFGNGGEKDLAEIIYDEINGEEDGEEAGNQELRIESSKNTLAMDDDSVIVTVGREGADSEMVEIMFSNGEEIIELSGNKSQTLVNGETEFVLNSVGETGKVKILASSSNGDYSETLDLIVSDRYLETELYTINEGLSDAEVDDILSEFTALEIEDNFVDEGNDEENDEENEAEDVLIDTTENNVENNTNNNAGDTTTNVSDDAGIDDATNSEGNSYEDSIIDSTSDTTNNDVIYNEENRTENNEDDSSRDNTINSGYNSVENNTESSGEFTGTIIESSEGASNEIYEYFDDAKLDYDGSYMNPDEFGKVVSDEYFVSEDNVNEDKEFAPLMLEDRESGCDPFSQTSCESWQDYYFNNNYFEKYIGFILSSFDTSNMFASVMNDSSLLAYLPDSSNPFINYAEDAASNVLIEENNSIDADGVSLIKVLVKSSDESYSGKISLAFVDEDQEEMLQFENGNTVDAENGEAVFYLRASTVSGEVLLKAYAQDTTIVDDEFSILLLPNEPENVLISSNTDTLIPNSSAEISVQVLDKFGNLVNNQYADIEFFADENLKISKNSSGNFDGVHNLSVQSNDNLGTYDIYAALKYDKSYDLSFEDIKNNTYDENLAFVSMFEIEVVSDIEIKANINDLTFSLELLKPNQEPVNFDGQILVSSNAQRGIIENDDASYTFVSDGKAQAIAVDIEIPNIKSDTIYLNQEASSPVRLQFVDVPELIDSSASQASTLKVEILDEFGNVVTNDDSTLVYFDLSDATEDLVQVLSNNPVRSENGIAELKIISTGRSGQVNITAKASKLEEDYASFKIKKILSRDVIDSFEVNSLYLNLIVDNAIDLSKNNTTAEALLYSGKTQVVSVYAEDINDGEGFMDNNKSILNFSAGQNVGNSTMYEADINLVNFGDPIVSINAGATSLTGFNSTIGQKIYSGNKTISDIQSIYFDDDEYEDLLVIFEDGFISVLRNENSNKRFKDLGFILNISQGIENIIPIDVNGDGLSDLMVSTKESCGANDTDHLSLYENLGGYFEEKEINLNIENQIYEMKSRDLNLDGCEDLVVSDSAGFIKTFYNNNCEEISPNYIDKFNFGFELNENIEVNDTLLFYFDEMEVDADSSPAISISVQNAENVSSTLGSEDFEAFDISEIKEAKKLGLYSNEDLLNPLSVSRTIKDVNGENLAKDDVLRFEIELQNNEALRKTNIYISDLFNPGMELDLSSLTCLEGDCANIEFNGTGINLRDYSISNINLRGNLSMKFSYEMKVKDMPKLNFDFGSSFEDLASEADEYPDMLVRSPYDDSGFKTYIYSEGLLSGGDYVDYKIKNVEVLTADTSDDTESSEIDVQDILDKMNADDDFDGIPDNWSSSSKNEGDFLTDITNDISSTLSEFTCNGGSCLPNPYNHAFLAPDINTGDPGLAAFSLHNGAAFVYPTFFTPASADPSSFFRMYVSPTATLGVGMATCYGPGVFPATTTACYAFALPKSMLDGLSGGLCSDISGLVDDAAGLVDGLVDSANEAIVNEDLGMVTVVNTGGNDTPDDAISGSFNYADPDIPVHVDGGINVRIPGFPSVITDWLDDQTNEIFNKLLDLPDIYFIYPDLTTIFSNSTTEATDYSTINNMHDLLRAIDSVPLIKLDTKDVVIKIPALSEAELLKYKRQVENLIEFEKGELIRISEYWQCDMNDVRQSFCDIFTLRIGDFIAELEVLLDAIDFLLNLPRDILTIRTMEQKYASQIICYLDAVSEYMGGYIKRQTRIIDSWMKAIEDVIRTFKDWQIILNLSAEYQASCDTCKSDRFSEIGILLNLFAVVPDPPILEFPKWPDIYFDMSQVETGVEIIWPNIVFRPEKIELPDLPYVDLPDSFPLILPEDFNIELSLASLGLSELENFKLPDEIRNLSKLNLDALIEFPDLPSLALPQLPDLPNPPKINPLPDFVAEFAADIRKIMKLLCVIKKGLIPIPEAFLATEFETLTNPSATALLPFTKDIAINMPEIEYSFLSEIHINARTKFAIDTEFIYQTVKHFADIYNNRVESFVLNTNEKLDIDLQGIVDKYINDYIREASMYVTEQALNAAEALQEGVDEIESSVEDSIQDGIDSTVDSVIDSMEDVVILEDLETRDFEDIIVNNFAQSIEKYSQKVEIYNKELSETFETDDYKLYGSSIVLSPESEILNRDISDIKEKLLSEDDIDSGNIGYLRDVRNALIAYTEDEKRMALDFDSIAEMETLTSQNSLIASIENDSFFEKNNLAETISLFDTSKLISQNTESTSSSIDTGVSADSGNVPVGIIVVQNGASQNIISYTKEINDSTNIVDMDADLDSDIDKIYSMGSNIYLKENYDKSPQEFEKGQIRSVSDASTLIKSDKVSGLSKVFENNEISRISFNKAAGAVSYIIDVRKNFYLDGSLFTVELDAEEYNSEVISYDLTLENGNYYVFVTAIFEDGSTSLISDPLIISPQICFDDDMPLPVLNKKEYEISIFETLEIDAGLSKDLSSEISAYYIENLDNGEILWSDKNVSVDEDKDGNPQNDKSNPLFNIGPYSLKEDIGLHNFVLNVVDENGNSSAEDFSVNVVNPEISIEESSTASYVSGESSVEQSIPFSLIRKRIIKRMIDGRIKDVIQTDKVLTESSFDNGKYYTDKNGGYVIDDFVNENLINVEDADGNIIAQINPESGNIQILEDGYYLKAFFAKAFEDRTKIQIVSENEIILGEIYLISDANETVSKHQNVSFESSPHLYSAASINDLDNTDDFEIVQFDATNNEYPNAASVVSGDNDFILIVDSSGNILEFDEDLSISVKENDFETDPLIYLISFEDSPIVEVYVKSDGAYSYIDKDSISKASPNSPDISTLASYLQNNKFTDIDENLIQVLNVLYENDIILGLETDDGIVIKPEEKISRAESVYSLLKMLCIDPSSEAYKPYSSGGFSDIFYKENGLDWYYPFIKEAYIRGLVDGYKGETDGNGLHPFKPDNQISLAEMTKIILEALEMLDQVDLSDFPEVENLWYANYIKVALDLSLVTQNPGLSGAYLLTNYEAINPDRSANRGELIKLASRVLDIYNCFEIDENQNSVSDYCEAKWDIEDLNADSDNDGLTNAEECEYNTNPYKADTDNGGVNDIDEIEVGTDPNFAADDVLVDNNSADDVLDNDNEFDFAGLDEGLYIVPAECNSCPCVSTFVSSNDLEEGDEIFTIISNFAETHIFAKSNTVKIKND